MNIKRHEKTKIHQSKSRYFYKSGNRRIRTPLVYETNASHIMNHIDKKFTDYHFELNDRNGDYHIQNESNLNYIDRTVIINYNFMSSNNNISENNQSQRNNISASLHNDKYALPTDTNVDIEDYLSGKNFNNEKLNTILGYLDKFKVQIKLLKILNN